MKRHLRYLYCICTIRLLYFEFVWDQDWVQVRGTESACGSGDSVAPPPLIRPHLYLRGHNIRRESGKPNILCSGDLKSDLKEGVKSDSPLLRSDIILAQSHETLSGVLRSSFIRPDSQSWTIFNRGAPLTRNNSSESPQHHIIIPHHTGVNKWSSWGCWCDSERLKWAISDH